VGNYAPFEQVSAMWLVALMLLKINDLFKVISYDVFYGIPVANIGAEQKTYHYDYKFRQKHLQYLCLFRRLYVDF
jgi:hypothetical protein